MTDSNHVVTGETNGRVDGNTVDNRAETLFTEDMTTETCPLHDVTLARRESRGSEFTEACGTWYDCPRPGCSTSWVDPSEELKAELEGQRARLAARAERLRVHEVTPRRVPEVGWAMFDRSSGEKVWPEGDRWCSNRRQCVEIFAKAVA